MPRIRNKQRPEGAQPGNLNAARHPWRALWKRGAVKPELDWVLPLMRKYADALEADKGGASEISAAEKSLIEIAAMARGCSSLILSAATQYGVIERSEEGGVNTWTVSPGLRELPRFLKTEATALLGLGLERRARKVQDLEAIRAEYTGKSSSEGGSATASADNGKVASTSPGTEKENLLCPS